MNFLIVNDDGYDSWGIMKLAKAAGEIGNVRIVAPLNQCSAMSQRITIRKEMDIIDKSAEIGIANTMAVSGTPADCVKVALNYLLPEKPDFVFSGINCGYNTGYDIAYSGTVGAAMEALMNGIPAMAFSLEYSSCENKNSELIDAYLIEIMKKLIETPIDRNKIWNVNFPGCNKADFKGILYDRKIARLQMFKDNYRSISKGKTSEKIIENGIFLGEYEKDSDVEAVMNNYISIGTIKCMVL